MSRFPCGCTLAEAKNLLRGVELCLATGEADRGPYPQLVGVYQILNVTKDALVVAPIINKAMSYETPRWEPRLDRKSSILIETGVERHKYPRDVVLFMHPVQLSLLHSLLGIDPSKAWRRIEQEAA